MEEFFLDLFEKRIGSRGEFAEGVREKYLANTKRPRRPFGRRWRIGKSARLAMATSEFH